MSNIAETQQDFDPSSQVPTIQTKSSALILDTTSMDSMYRLAEIMAKGRSTIPDHLKGNVGDCMAIVMQAVSWGMNPYAVAQKTHTVNGTLGYEAQLVNAVISTSGVTVDRFKYDWYGPWERIIGKTKVIKVPAKDKGDGKKEKEYEFRVPAYGMEDENGLGVRVWATIKGEDEPRTLDLLLVQASVRNSPLWATDPKQQLAYLAVKRWARLYAPDVILGVYSPDELEDGRQPMRDITPASKNAKPAAIAANKQADIKPASKELLAKIRAAADNSKESFLAAWKDVSIEDRRSLSAEMDDLAMRCDQADKRTAEAHAEAIRREKEKVINPGEVDDFVSAMDKAESR
jgi:hypothetical protein